MPSRLISTRIHWLLPLVLLLAAGSQAFGADAVRAFPAASSRDVFEDETDVYGQTPDTGVVARLRERIESGAFKLAHDPEQGYLPALLDALGISRTSQTLVFSKTSMQREHIAPRTPRAIFFNDQAYVGFIPKAPLLEISAVDPKLGAVFYQLEQKPAAKPKLVRVDACLECHTSNKSLGVPGHLIRSFAVDDNGVADLRDGVSIVNHRTPIAERWGGWYVTGRGGREVHRGNLFGPAAFARHAQEPAWPGPRTNLDGLIATNDFPAGGTSDIAALMVLEHQTHMHNFITRLNRDSTAALRTSGTIESLKPLVTAFMKYLLFVDEAPLVTPIRPGPDYIAQFEAIGPRDGRGRSLRQFDLQTRLFKFPCSFLIYSEAFDQLPAATRAAVYQRLWDVLTGKEADPAFAKLSAGNREAIREILRATKPGLPDYWRAQAAGAGAGRGSAPASR